MVAAQPLRARDAEILQSMGAVPAHIAGQFREAVGFQQADSGQYFVFDRRAHAVYTIAGDTAKKVIEVGAACVPAISAAFADGRLSYSKVRALTRVAANHDEDLLLAYALDASASQVEERCRQIRNVEPE